MANLSQNRQPTTMSIKVDTAREVDYDYDQPESIDDSQYKAKSFLPGDNSSRGQV